MKGKGKCDYCAQPAVISAEVTKDGGRWWSKPWMMRRRIRGCRAHVDKALDTLHILACVEEHQAVLLKADDALSKIRSDKDGT